MTGKDVAGRDEFPGMDRDGPQVTAVLWDIDGTLLTSGGVSSRIFLDTVGDVVGRRPDGRGLDFGGRIDPEIAALLLESLDADQQLIPDILARLEVNTIARRKELQDGIRPLPGVLETLSLLDEAGVIQTVVTGNIRSVGTIKLQAAQLIPPIEERLGGYGDSGPNRVEVARAALELLAGAGWRRADQHCWIVGDTPRDLSCARALGLRCALVGSGRHSAASMADLGADVVIPGLDHGEALLELWNLNDHQRSADGERGPFSGGRYYR